MSSIARFLAGLFRRGAKEERIRRALKQGRSVVLGELPRYKKRPQLVFVGSSKGGVGKSFLTANLVVAVSALSPSSRTIYAVDLDFDNQTIGHVLPPEGRVESFIRRAHDNNLNLLSVADVFEMGLVPTSGDWVIMRFKGHTVGCSGAQLKYSFLLIPAYDENRIEDQRKIMKGLGTKELRAGVEALISYFTEKNASKDVLVFFDGKQKSILDQDVELINMQLVERSDVFLLVTEPPYLNFDDLVAPYRGMLEKMIVVVNKVNPSVLDSVLLLINSAISNNVPVFVIPEASSDASLYTAQQRAPAAERLSRPTALHSMALAYFLNLIDDDRLRVAGCDASVYAILSNYRKLFWGERVRESEDYR